MHTPIHNDLRTGAHFSFTFSPSGCTDCVYPTHSNPQYFFISTPCILFDSLSFMGGSVGGWVSEWVHGSKCHENLNSASSIMNAERLAYILSHLVLVSSNQASTKVLYMSISPVRAERWGLGLLWCNLFQLNVVVETLGAAAVRADGAPWLALGLAIAAETTTLGGAPGTGSASPASSSCPHRRPILL